MTLALLSAFLVRQWLWQKLGHISRGGSTNLERSWRHLAIVSHAARAGAGAGAGTGTGTGAGAAATYEATTADGGEAPAAIKTPRAARGRRDV